MDKDRLNKLDQLFQEKLQQHEISPEEDYWPYLEKSLDKISFYKFGWKHINIYNISVGILLLAIPLFYLFQVDKEKEEPSIPNQEITDSVKQSDSLLPEPASIETNVQTVRKKQKKQNLKTESNSENPETKPQDSLPNITPTEEIVPVVTTPPKVEEKKLRPKKIIYVVQQDTIVEKDTVKVRRKRKK